MKRLFALTLALMLLVFCAPALPAQADGTATTVMMYMCGTDLQSDCVMDMYEMCEASFSDDINIIVQAGGASKIKLFDALSPYVIEEEELVRVLDTMKAWFRR